MDRLKSLFLLDSETIYLNHGSFGAVPKPVLVEYQKFQKLIEKDPTLFYTNSYFDFEANARASLANYIHTEPGSLVLLPNVTHAVNIVAKSIPFQRGEEILISDHEYGACEILLNFIAESTGVKIVKAHIPIPVSSRNEIVELIWKKVTPKTRLIFLSHITSPTGIRFPIKEICFRARKQNIRTCIDGAHAPGQIELNIENLEPDFYAGNCHKWMMTPRGAGFLYVRPEMQEIVKPLVISWGYAKNKDFTTGSSFIDKFIWSGTLDPSALLCIPTALEFMKQHHWDKIRSSSHKLGIRFREEIRRITGLGEICPHDMFNQMASAMLPPKTDVKRLQQHLYNDFKIQIPLLNWNGNKIIRASFQGYNSIEDLQLTIAALNRTLDIFATQNPL